MTPGSALFIVSAVLCLAGAVTTVVSRSPVRAAMGLLGTILGIALLFLKLRAEFLSAIQLIVYAGAVVVLFVFVIMLLGTDAGSEPESEARSKIAPPLAGGMFLAFATALFGLLGGAIKTPTAFTVPSPDHGTIEAVGTEMFQNTLVPFELTTALLIVAVVGAIAVGRGRQGQKPNQRVIKNPQDFYVGPVMERDNVRQPEPKESV